MLNKKCIIYNNILLETTHFITHIQKITCINVSFQIRCSQLYKLSTQRLNIDMKPKEVLIEAVNKFLKEKLKEKGFVFSDSQLKLTKKLKDGLIGVIGIRAMSYS